MLIPNGSMHCRSTRPPGCGGFFIAIGQISFSDNPLINVINVQHIAIFQSKDDAPVGANSYRPKTAMVAFERVQMKVNIVTGATPLRPVAKRETNTHP
jgi:hypothetical protein